MALWEGKCLYNWRPRHSAERLRLCRRDRLQSDSKFALLAGSRRGQQAVKSGIFAMTTGCVNLSSWEARTTTGLHFERDLLRRSAGYARGMNYQNRPGWASHVHLVGRPPVSLKVGPRSLLQPVIHVPGSRGVRGSPAQSMWRIARHWPCVHASSRQRCI